MRQIRRPVRSAFSIFIDTLCEGTVPAWYDDDGYPWLFATERDAQREIADTQLTMLQQFLDGERDFDDAITVEDFVMPVDVWPDRTITISTGEQFGKRS